ncbi:MAG: CDP-diacylglycerol--glycerol-3-phosphate 3-phosphatidyltransferase [Glaciecola sp.]|jgi:CDP-diacylglycerol--glycerol-3-phosphate 3-phosphatidyltransferase
MTPEERDLHRARELAREAARAGMNPVPISAEDLLEKHVEPHWFNVPNAVTFLRVLLVPVILWLLAQDDPSSRWWALGIFMFAALTDSIDGWVARRWHGVTRWGQLADPIADKLLIVGSLASLAAVGDLPWWAVGVIVLREVAVTALRLVLVARQGLVMPASWLGKAKTITQVVAVIAFLWPGAPETLRTVLLAIAIALTFYSGLDYAFRVGRLTREPIPSVERS